MFRVIDILSQLPIMTLTLVCAQDNHFSCFFPSTVTFCMGLHNHPNDLLSLVPIVDAMIVQRIKYIAHSMAVEMADIFSMHPLHEAWPPGFGFFMFCQRMEYQR